jgi:5-carboxymethyl-2-hydroxymuconate isomerase
MPHLTVEYTSNLIGLDVRQVLATLNAALAESGHFDSPDIKSRAVRLDDILIGDGTDFGAYVHVTLRLMEGRAAEIKARLGARLLAELRKFLRNDRPYPVQLTVEICELDRSSYAKVVVWSEPPPNLTLSLAWPEPPRVS